MRRVVVTGLGLCSPLGVGVGHVWRQLLQGRSGITALPRTPEYASLASQVVGLVPRGGGGTSAGCFKEEEWVSAAERKSMSLCSVFALCAASEALGDAGWRVESEAQSARTGVSIGCSLPNLEEIASAGRLNDLRRISPYFVPRILTNMPASIVNIRFNLTGPLHSVATACAAGVQSIGDASCMIARGAADVMLAGATEASVHPIAFASFARAKALSTKFNSEPQRASRPFDSQRDGFVISEGAGMVVLEELEHARERGARVYAEVLGYGMAGEAHHITAPRPDGRGAQLSMLATLKDARIAPEDVGHINAHATSTPLGDAAENRAIKSVFNSHARNLLIYAPKSALGHLLAAAGAVELVTAVLAVSEGVVPPTLNLSHTEPEFDLNYVRGEAGVEWKGGEEDHRRIALVNSFGFGGVNATLCIAQL